MVIPKSLFADMYLKIHLSHLGIEACLRRARQCIYWPGMSAEMKHHISAFETCRELDSTTHAKETDVPRGPIWSLEEDRHRHLYS